MMGKINYLIITMALVCLGCIVGCAPANRLVSGLRYKSNLYELDSDKRILIEKGTEDNAERIRLILDSCIEVTQSFYETPFTKSVTISLCATQKSHVKHCGDYKKSRGMVNWGRVFIAPPAFTSNSYGSVLVHELTHLHTVEKVGIFHYVNDIPAWFSEGLSVFVSNGAGAESYSDSQAMDWLLSGRHIIPTAKGSLMKPSGYVSSLPWPMFYRQSELFVKYLINIDIQKFRSLLRNIEQKKHFRKAFVQEYNMLPAMMFDRFLKEIGTAKNSS